MIRKLMLRLSGGGELGAGDNSVRNWRETATVVPRNDVFEYF
jgi:hypothetical protein